MAQAPAPAPAGTEAASVASVAAAVDRTVVVGSASGLDGETVHSVLRSFAVVGTLVLGVGLWVEWWSQRQQALLGSEVAALARPGDIRMLSSETCAACASARAWLREHRVAFDECLIERDAQCRADFEGTRAPGTPVIVVRGVPQAGFDLELLRRGLQRRPV